MMQRAASRPNVLEFRGRMVRPYPTQSMKQQRHVQLLLAPLVHLNRQELL